MNLDPLVTVVTGLLRRISERIILHPDQLEITPTTSSTYFSIRMRAHVSDTAKLIGEKGCMFRALRTVVTEVGNRYGVTVDLCRLEEPKPGTTDKFTRFKPNLTPETTDLQALLEEILKHSMKDADAVECVWDNLEIETHVTACVSMKEPARTVANMNEALRTIFTAIGQARGRIIRLNLSPDQPATEQQPTSSKGRFAA